MKNFTDIAVGVVHEDDVSKEYKKEADRNRILARNQLLLFGSDDVIKAYDAWMRHTDKDQKREDELVICLFLAIRKDVLGKTRVTTKHLESLNPYTWM